MELRQLKYFITIAETLNYSKAATMLFISQPSLSKQIVQLEKDLGTELFNRNRQKVELTDSGRLLYIKGKEILEQTEALASLLPHPVPEEKQERVLLNVGITDVLLEVPLYANALLETEKKMAQKYPELEINIMPTRMSMAKKDLSSRLLDLCIVLTDDLQNKNITDCSYSVFHEMPFYIVAAKDVLPLNPDKDTLRDFLSGKDIFVYENRARVHMQVYHICNELNARPNSVTTLEDPRRLIRVARGEGVSFSWNGVAEYGLQNYLGFAYVPVPSAKVYSLFIWKNVNDYIQDFSNAYWKYVSQHLSDFWCPISAKNDAEQEIPSP